MPSTPGGPREASFLSPAKKFQHSKDTICIRLGSKPIIPNKILIQTVGGLVEPLDFFDQLTYDKTLALEDEICTHEEHINAPGAHYKTNLTRNYFDGTELVAILEGHKYSFNHIPKFDHIEGKLMRYIESTFTLNELTFKPSFLENIEAHAVRQFYISDIQLFMSNLTKDYWQEPFFLS